MAVMATTTFFYRTYDEALSLLTEARNYVAGLHHHDATPFPASVLLAQSCETMRLTARLTHVMAWLIAQRAVHAGEITPEESISEQFSLGGRSICLEESEYLAFITDESLGALLDRSLRLYVRVSRLETMVRHRVTNAIGTGAMATGADPLQ
jgi:regulator of CtrA degradation